MTTFENAREIVRQQLRQEYPAVANLTISASGLQNADSYQIFVSVDSSEYRVLEDGPAHVVNKSTGLYSKKWGYQYVIPDATPCGAPDPDDEL